MSTISLSHLTKRYGPVLAVDDLSFEAGPGRVTGFLGPNGSGKTSTLRILLGLVTPDAGEVRLLGRSVPSELAAAVPEARRLWSRA